MIQLHTFKAHNNILLTDYMINWLIQECIIIYTFLCYVVLCIIEAELTECYTQILIACMHMHWACEPQYLQHLFLDIIQNIEYLLVFNGNGPNTGNHSSICIRNCYMYVTYLLSASYRASTSLLCVCHLLVESSLC